MPENIKQLLAETERLNKENKALQQQLLAAMESIHAIKEGNIDALVVADKEALKIYTEKTADKIYRILIEKMPEGAVTLNEDGTILYCNSNFADLVKLPLQKAIGTKFSDFIEDTSKERIDTLFQQGRESHTQIEANINSNDGSAIPVLMSVNTLSWEDNSVLSIIITDLTTQNKNQEELKRRARQLEQMNAELETSNRDLVTFTYVSSHDLQEPLRKIKNFTGILLDKEWEKLSDQGKNYLQRTYETANGMQILILDLIAYSRTKSDERKFEKTDLGIIVDEVKKDLEEVILEKKATIEVASLCNTSVIQFQFRQLMHNLISNSLKFSKSDITPHIEIKTEIVKGSELTNKKVSREADYCHIIYTDNGIGFDPQYKDRIFEVFQRLHSKEEYLGTGMGLAICKRIVENHGGVITATGTLNLGARFDIYIPVEQY